MCEAFLPCHAAPGQYLAQEPPYLSRMPQPTVYCSVGGWKYLVSARWGHCKEGKAEGEAGGEAEGKAEGKARGMAGHDEGQGRARRGAWQAMAKGKAGRGHGGARHLSSGL